MAPPLDYPEARVPLTRLLPSLAIISLTVVLGACPKPTADYTEYFSDGIKCYCTDQENGKFLLEYKNSSGDTVLSFGWPQDEEDLPEESSCEVFCDMGALYYAYESATLLTGADIPADSLEAESKECSIEPTYFADYQQCGNKELETCFGACGLRCVGCEIELISDDQECGEVEFQCYSRPCCERHDQCLDLLGWNFGAKLGCHLAALFDGCGLKDALGSTAAEDDAVCMNPRTISIGNYDSDSDGIPDTEDDCPDVANPDQSQDKDGDKIGDACDECEAGGGNDRMDVDNDGTPDDCDACKWDVNDDSDEDGVCDSDDPCPQDYPDDADGNGVCDSQDVTPTPAPTPPQSPTGTPQVDMFLVPDEYTTIQAAVDAAGGAGGGTVQVRDGDYNEKVVISWPKIAIQGSGADLVTIRNKGEGYGVVTILEEGDEASISGVTIRMEGGGYEAAILSEGDNVTVEDCVLEGEGEQWQFGVFLVAASGFEISRCKITNSDLGLQADQESEAFADSLWVEGSRTVGVYVDSGSSLVLQNSFIVRNTHGVVVYSDNVSLMNNTLADNTQAGLYVRGDGIFPSSKNDLYLNNKYSIFCDTWNYASVDHCYQEGNDYYCILTGLFSTGLSALDGDYHLTSSSDLIDAGTNSGAPGYDYDEDSRPVDGDGNGTATVDVGADEFVRQ